MTQKFKVGDKVKIISLTASLRFGYSTAKNNTLNRIGVIDEFDSYYGSYIVTIDSDFFHYSHEDLKIVNIEESIEEMKSEVERLQQLIAKAENENKITIDDIVPFAVFEFNHGRCFYGTDGYDTAIIIPVYDNKFILSGCRIGNGLWDIDDTPIYTSEQLCRKLNNIKAKRTNKTMKVVEK